MEPNLDNSGPKARRFQIGVRTLIGLVVCCAVVSWAARYVWENEHPEIAAVRELGAPSPSERVHALRELGRFDIENSAAVIPSLIVALVDTEPEVRSAAADALMYVGSGTLMAGSANEAVGGAITALIASLKDPQSSVRFTAANSLEYLTSLKEAAGVIDTTAVTVALAATLSDQDNDVRHAALKALLAGKRGVPDDPPMALIAALNDESATIRAMAVRVLASFRCSLDPWIPPLLRLLEHDEPPVRAACAAALDRIVPPAATAASLPTLVEALGRGDKEVRLHAVNALMRMERNSRDSVSIPALLAIVKGSYAVTQVRIGRSSARVIDDPRPDETAQLALVLFGQIAPATESAGEVIATLTHVVRCAHPFLRGSAAEALGKFGPAAKSAIPDLIKLARNVEIGSASGNAADALGRIAPDTPLAGEVVAGLTEALHSNYVLTRQSAIDALARFGPKAALAIPQLRALLKDRNVATRSAAAKALAALGDNE